MTPDDEESVKALLKASFPAEKVTQAERLMKIETLLERAIADLDDIKRVQTETKVALDADKADLAALKNRGAGILIGVAMVAGVVGAKLGAIVQAVGGLLR